MLPRSGSVRNEDGSTTANFQFVSVGIFEEECVIPWTVFGPDLGAFQVSAARLADDSGDDINLLSRVRPERDSRIVRPVIRVLGEAKKFRGFVAVAFLKCTPLFCAFVQSKSNCRKNFAVELLSARPITDAQVDVIEETYRQDLRNYSYPAPGREIPWK